MKMQEMRFGLLHLIKKMENERVKNIFEPKFERGLIFEAEAGRPKADAVASELDEPRWSVVSFDRIEAFGLTYRQAVTRLNELNSQRTAGLCIVSDEAAARINDL